MARAPFKSKDKRINKLVESAIGQGFRPEMGGKHGKLYPPDGSRPILVPLTPGNDRAYKNTRGDLRRAGYKGE